MFVSLVVFFWSGQFILVLIHGIISNKMPPLISVSECQIMLFYRSVDQPEKYWWTAQSFATHSACSYQQGHSTASLPRGQGFRVSFTVAFCCVTVAYNTCANLTQPFYPIFPYTSNKHTTSQKFGNTFPFDSFSFILVSLYVVDSH